MKLTIDEYDECIKNGLVATEYMHAPRDITEITDEYYGGGHPVFSVFGEECFLGNTYAECRDFSTAQVDETDCKIYDIDANEWRDGQKQAIQHAMSMYKAGAV